MASKQENYSKVYIKRTITVYPRAHPPHAHHTSLLQLSNLDRKCPMLMYLVFFYRSPPPHKELSGGSLFTALKMGLEETLSAWYPAAGRLSLNPANGKLDLECNNSGALLVEAVTQVRISDLGDLSQYTDFFENLVFRPPFSGNFSEMPLVVAQLTKFGCGGYALGVGTNHSLFDGLANFNFLRAWASKTTGRADGEMEQVQPVHERGRLLVGHGQTQQQLAGYDKKNLATRIVAFDHLYQLIRQAATIERLGPDGKLLGCKFSEMEGNSQGHLVLSTFYVSSSMVGRLKSKVNVWITGSSCSSFEVIAAHLWKARTKALGIGKERMVCLQFAVDTRTRMAPPLPKGFTGNAYVLSSISCTAGELEQASLISIVEKIKEAKLAVTEDYVKAYLEALEAPQGALPPLPELTIVSDWTRTPYHIIDFGLEGAVYASPLAPPVPQVAYFMQRPGDGGGMDVRIGLAQKNLPAFSHHFLNVL